MHIFDNEISLGCRNTLEEFLGSYEYKTSGLSYSSLYMWREINQFSWQIFGDYLCISGSSNLEGEKEEPFLFPPLTRTGEYEPEGLKKAVLAAKEVFEEKGYVFSMRLLPFHMIGHFKDAFPNKTLCFMPDRPNYDYVYRTQDLIDLAGRDYHQKKNHLNYFKNHFEYEYMALTSDMADEAIAFIREFNERKQLPAHEMDLLLMEEEAMGDVFHNLEKVGYLAGVIRIDGKIEALSIGGYLGKKTVTVHVEKANIAFRGLYQAINNEFCKHVASRIKLINREEDMGIEGLRKAKLSYNPCKMIEKYIVIFKTDL